MAVLVVTVSNAEFAVTGVMSAKVLSRRMILNSERFDWPAATAVIVMLARIPLPFTPVGAVVSVEPIELTAPAELSMLPAKKDSVPPVARNEPLFTSVTIAIKGS